jgi:AraC-like DNA-binding protein
MNMQFSNIDQERVFRSEKFRTPLDMERDAGLWVDRIGTGRDFRNLSSNDLRILGLFAVVGVRSGNGRFMSPLTGEITVRQGDAILLFPDVPHRYGPDSVWETQWIVWDGDDAERIVRMGYFRSDRPIISGGAEAVAHAWTMLQDRVDVEDLAAILERKVGVLELLLSLYRHRVSGEGKGDGSGDSIRRALAYIDANLGRELSVASLAARYAMSEVHFRRVFHRVTGRSPKAYVASRKMSKAKEYLSSRLPVKEAAALLGYRDEFYFRKVFRSIVGQTPGDFIRGGNVFDGSN